MYEIIIGKPYPSENAKNVHMVKRDLVISSNGTIEDSAFPYLPEAWEQVLSSESPVAAGTNQ